MISSGQIQTALPIATYIKLESPPHAVSTIIYINFSSENVTADDMIQVDLISGQAQQRQVL